MQGDFFGRGISYSGLGAGHGGLQVGHHGSAVGHQGSGLATQSGNAMHHLIGERHQCTRGQHTQHRARMVCGHTHCAKSHAGGNTHITGFSGCHGKRRGDALHGLPQGGGQGGGFAGDRVKRPQHRVTKYLRGELPGLGHGKQVAFGFAQRGGYRIHEVGGVFHQADKFVTAELALGHGLAKLAHGAFGLLRAGVAQAQRASHGFNHASSVCAGAAQAFHGLANFGVAVAHSREAGTLAHGDVLHGLHGRSGLLGAAGEQLHA